MAVPRLDTGCGPERRIFMGDQLLIERRRTWNAGLREHIRQLEQRWNRAHLPLGVVHHPVDVDAKAPPSDLSRSDVAEHGLKILETTRANLLLIGSPRTVSLVLRVIERSLAPPVLPFRAGYLKLPESAIGTMVIHDADHLRGDEQDALNDWVVLHPDTQVIITASGPLFPLVVRNRFSDVLFYRLNVLTAIVGMAERWRCPVCRAPIEHKELEGVQRAGQVYRCPVCCVDFALNWGSSWLTIASALHDSETRRPAPHVSPASSVAASAGSSRRSRTRGESLHRKPVQASTTSAISPRGRKAR